MKKIVLRIWLGIAAATLIVYAVDFALLRYRLWRNLAPYDTLTVRYYYQVEEKNNRTEYEFASAQSENCVNSLFPHQGLAPCWYARRHTERPIKI